MPYGQAKTGKNADYKWSVDHNKGLEKTLKYVPMHMQFVALDSILKAFSRVPLL